MKLLSLTLLSIFVLLLSCSKKETSERSKSKVVSKHKNIQPQEAPPREIIDINEEGYSVDEVLKIDKEIPVLEIICGKDWKQTDLDKLAGMQMLDTLRLENMAISDLNLLFVKNIKSLKIISFKNSKVSAKTIESLKNSTVNRIDCSGTNLSKSELNTLSSTLTNIEISQ